MAVEVLFECSKFEDQVFSLEKNEHDQMHIGCKAAGSTSFIVRGLKEMKSVLNVLLINKPG